MKKLFFTLLFGFGFMLVGFANQNSVQQPNNTVQKADKSQEKEKGKYDFSLFKFITPAQEEQDSSKIKQEEVLIDKKSKDDTTYLFDKVTTCLKYT